jgi:hypothetical protein
MLIRDEYLNLSKPEKKHILPQPASPSTSRHSHEPNQKYPFGAIHPRMAFSSSTTQSYSCKFVLLIDSNEIK